MHPVEWGVSPFIDGMRIFLALLLMMPLYVMIDAMRSWRHAVEADFNEPKEGMRGYVWLGGIFLLIGLFGYVPSTLGMVGFPRAEAFLEPVVVWSGLARFFMVVLLFAYLKRVVFNKVMRRYRKEMKRQSRLAKDDSENL